MRLRWATRLARTSGCIESAVVDTQEVLQCGGSFMRQEKFFEESNRREVNRDMDRNNGPKVLRSFRRASEGLSLQTENLRMRFLFDMVKKVLRGSHNRSPSLRYPSIPRQSLKFRLSPRNLPPAHFPAELTLDSPRVSQPRSLNPVLEIDFVHRACNATLRS